MNITTSIVKTLLKVIDAGLCHGAGDMDMPGNFCVQQAVSHAISMDELGDSPVCVGEAVRSFGVCMNDQDWATPKARAEGMRRFAIAQLGSDNVSGVEFNRIVIKLWNDIAPEIAHLSDGYHKAQDLIGLCKTDNDRRRLCGMAVKALQQLETDGSKYLYMTELPKEEQQKIKDRYFHAPQLQWRNYNVTNQGQTHIAQ